MLSVRARIALAAILLAPAAALAQITITSSYSPSPQTVVYIGQPFCKPAQPIDFIYNLGSVPQPGIDTVDLWITKDTGTCTGTTDPSSPSIHLAAPSQTAQSATVTVHPIPSELLPSETDLPGGCSNTTTSAKAPYTEYFCVRRKTAGLTGSTVTANFFQVNFALVGPSAPSAPSVTPGDSHLKLSWTSNDSGDKSYDVFVVPENTAVDTGRAAAHNLSTTTADVNQDSFGDALQNDVRYDVYVRSIDLYGNTSALSGKSTEAPIAIDDFYRHYCNEGGSATGGGGCATGGPAGFFGAAAVAFALWRRRRAALLTACLCTLAPAARAADWTGLDRAPRRWLIAFKIDRYDPQIDTEKGLTGTPYHDIFHGRAPLRYQLELDWQVAHPFGAVLIGATAGFWQNHGKGLISSSGLPSEDTTLLDVVPFGAIATYRFDQLADRYQWLPIVPYAQAGLMAALWSSFNGNGDVTTAKTGGRGSGWSYGYTTALGIALDLSALDAPLAREAYIDTSIQRTALFAEYGWTRLNNFGNSGRLILSDRAWRFGLSVEF